jgi:hypothetical protein
MGERLFLVSLLVLFLILFWTPFWILFSIQGVEHTFQCEVSIDGIKKQVAWLQQRLANWRQLGELGKEITSDEVYFAGIGHVARV